MKKILTANIETPVRQPFTRYSLEHLQSAYTDMLTQLSNSPLFTQPEYFDYNFPQIVWGCSPVSLIGQIYNIPKGLIKFNDELYYVNPTVFEQVVGPNVLCVYIETTYISQDPLELTDGSLENVHQIQEIVLKSGVSGSGGNTAYTYVCDFSELLLTPTITELYPTLALTDASVTPISLTGTTVYTPDEILKSSIDQFGILEFNAIFKNLGTVSEPLLWRKLTEIPLSLLPSGMTENYYTTCVVILDSSNVSIQPLLITPFGNIYFNNNYANQSPSVKVDIKYKV